MNVKAEQQKHVECRQRNNSTLRGKQEGGVDAVETLSTKSAQTVQKQFNALLKKVSLLVEVQKDLQQMTKQVPPTDFATEFRGIGPYELFLPIQRIA